MTFNRSIIQTAVEIMNRFFRIYIIISVLLISILSLVNCKDQYKQVDNTIMFSKFPTEDTIKFSNICEYKNGAIGMIKLVDSSLIIFNVNEGAKYFLNNYSLTNGQVSKGYLSMGKGPGQAIGARGIGTCGNSLWIQDISLKKILTINKAKALSNKTVDYFSEYPVKDDYYMIAFKDSLHYFGVGHENSAFKVQEIELFSGKKINEFGSFEKVPDNIKFGSFKAAHQCFIHVKPSGEKIVLAYRFTDAIEIFDIRTQKSFIMHGPEKFDVEFQTAGSQMHRTNKTRFAFVSGGGTVTDNYIYMLYSGDLTQNEGSIYAKCIYVFDWNGNPIRKLNFDGQIEGIAVSKDDKTLYAYDVNSGFLIKSDIN
jgi:hypothetical protein